MARACNVCGEEACFVHCIFCGVDCEADEEHAPECPSNTGVYEVQPEADNKPCEYCGFYEDPPMLCSECNAPLYLGDHYTHRWVEEDVGEVICLGCAAQEAVA